MRPIDDIRRENLAVLVREEGGQASLARKINKDKNQVNQWLGKGVKRNMSGPTARKIERICGKPEGWFDTDHTLGVREARETYLESQPLGLEVDRLADLIETLDAALAQANRTAPPRTKARVVASLYASNVVGEALRAALVGMLATLED